MTQETGWAFVGSSGWVTGRFAPSVRAAGQRIVGAYGSSAAGSARFAAEFDCRAYGSLDELLADDAVDVVWIASPTDLHPRHALAAADAGRAVLVEKPLAPDGAAGRALAEDLAKAGTVAATGFQHRFNPALAVLARALDEGRVGTVSALLVQHGGRGPAAPSAWRRDPVRSGGWSVADVGTHLIDIVRALLGEVEFCAARLSSPTRGLAVDDLSWLMLRRDEATAVLRASSGSPGPTAIELSGSEGWLRISDFWGGGGVLTDSEGRTEVLEPVDLYAAQVAAFSATVHGAAWAGATLADGAKVGELLSQARRLGG